MVQIEDRATGHLVLTRKRGERLRLTLPGGGHIWLEVLELGSNKVRLDIAAPRAVLVEREEIIGKDRPGTSPGGEKGGQ